MYRYRGALADLETSFIALLNDAPAPPVAISARLACITPPAVVPQDTTALNFLSDRVFHFRSHGYPRSDCKHGNEVTHAGLSQILPLVVHKGSKDGGTGDENQRRPLPHLVRQQFWLIAIASLSCIFHLIIPTTRYSDVQSPTLECTC